MFEKFTYENCHKTLKMNVKPFQFYAVYTHKIENRIIKKSDRVQSHLIKWEKFTSLLNVVSLHLPTDLYTNKQCTRDGRTTQWAIDIIPVP